MPRTLLLTGGGTAGHFMPLLTILTEVERIAPTVRCVYVGSRSDLSSVLLDKHPKLERVESFSGKLHRYPTLKQIGEIVRLGKGLVMADSLVKKINPDVVFAKGGAITVPIVLAAARQRRKIFSHESDVRAGIANQIAARYAQTVFTAFPIENYPQLQLKKLLFTGQPVRPEFFDREPIGPLKLSDRHISTELPIVLILGGSQGAHTLNSLISEQWEHLLMKYTVVHQCGAGNFASLQKLAAMLPEIMQKRLFLVPFIYEELPYILRSAALVVSRAGGTIAELAAGGAASLLIPLPTSAQGHQQANAEVFRRAGAAMVINENELDSMILAKEIIASIDAPDQLTALRQAIASFAKPDAAITIAKKLVEAL